MLKSFSFHFHGLQSCATFSGPISHYDSFVSLACWPVWLPLKSFSKSYPSWNTALNWCTAELRELVVILGTESCPWSPIHHHETRTCRLANTSVSSEPPLSQSFLLTIYSIQLLILRSSAGDRSHLAHSTINLSKGSHLNIEFHLAQICTSAPTCYFIWDAVNFNSRSFT